MNSDCILAVKNISTDQLIKLSTEINKELTNRGIKEIAPLNKTYTSVNESKNTNILHLTKLSEHIVSCSKYCLYKFDEEIRNYFSTFGKNEIHQTDSTTYMIIYSDPRDLDNALKNINKLKSLVE